ncbi:MAG: hypothetical protein NZM40_08765 [Sphingomonadaceae bacterium]|uniref:hypothetical protein n=1 Tax=Thermaurantiacus sp. TaxID=2820283 RepID=UPI00298EF556|nr:hypothetical protein [Thermaurantiacus sp.]MCS6987500.1 hypothetical protein [Sphingomonadaceae bacterium]MDW8415101.1 hypothetical protein [Thermaurantiacus sp.]
MTRSAIAAGALPVATTRSAGEQFLTNCIIILSFFPFFRILPLGDAETQPLAAMAALVGILIYGFRWDFVSRASLALIFFGLAFALLAVLGMNISATSVGLQTAAFLAPIILFVYIWGRLDQVQPASVFFCGAAYLTLGTLQYLGKVPSFLHDLLGRLIGRYEEGLLTLGRGVVMFTPEPAYAAKILALFVAFCVAWHRDRRLPTLVFWMLSLVTLAIVVLVNRSVIGIVLMMTLLGLYAFFLLSGRARVLLAAALAVGLVVSFQMARNRGFETVSADAPRNLQVASLVMARAVEGDLRLTDVLRLGSARLMTSLAGFEYTASLPLLGTGLGRGETAVRRVLDNDPLLNLVDFERNRFGNLKPHGWLPAWTTETGILGLAVGATLLLAVLGRARTASRRDLAASVALWSTAFLIVGLTGPHSLPVPWLMFGLASHRVAAGTSSADRLSGQNG